MTTVRVLSSEELDIAVGAIQRLVDIEVPLAEGLIKYCIVREFKKKTILVDVGGMENYVNIVIKGLVRKFARKGKSEFTLQLATEGHLIHSEIAFIKQIPSPVVIECIEPTVMLSLGYTQMIKALDSVVGGERMARQIMQLMFAKKDDRMYKLLQQTPKERFLDFIENNSHLLQRVPQKYLASYLNIKPETFSRMKHLVKRKS